MPAFRPDRALTMALSGILVDAGVNAMRHRGRAEARLKADRSPVSLADEEGEAIILRGLKQEAGEIAVVSEEASERGLPPQLPSCFFLLDPLDGTKEFLNGHDDFTVNLALVDDGAPVFGIIYAPARRALYFTGGQKAWCASPIGGREDLHRTPVSTLRMRTPPADGLDMVASRSHAGDEEAQMRTRYTIRGTKAAGSSLKFCLLAEGEADLYPRLGPTMEWDIAAGHAILLAAGGTLAQWDGAPLRYGKLETGLKNSGFLAKHPTL